MSTLHTVNKSPYANSTLTSCLKICTSEDGILLLEDGVFGAVQASQDMATIDRLIQRGVRVFVLINDVKARGLEEKISPKIIPVDYDTFVQLTVEYRRVQSWY